MHPIAQYNGKNTTAHFYGIFVARPGSTMDVGFKVFLNARGARTEIITMDGNISHG
jgi:Fe-S cluster assembly scaffold protein SufB